MEWISIGERLPEEGSEYSYLITDGEEISYGYLDYNLTDIEDNNLYWVDDIHILKTCVSGWPKVTHWMPLPEPPRYDGMD